MLRSLYDWTMSLAASRHAPVGLAAISFAESSFFPVPPDVMLAPMVLARPERAWTYATICTVASVLGGALGYAIGYYLTGFGRSCDGLTLQIVAGSDKPIVFTLVGARSGLPDSARPLLAARPKNARPQYLPDQTLTFSRIRL